MRRILIGLLLKKWNSSLAVKKNLKLLFLFGILSFALMGGLLIWAGVSTLNFVASTGKDLVHSAQLYAQAENLSIESGGLRILQCWQNAQSLLDLSFWTQGSTGSNLAKLKSVCLQDSQLECQGINCKPAPSVPNTLEAGSI